MSARQVRRARAKHHSGAVAVEFALAFPVLFGLFYAIVSYAIPFMMLQTFHAAAADGARAAVSVILAAEETEPCPASYQAIAASTAEAEARQRITWLDSLMIGVAEADRVQTEWIEECVLRITVSYPNYTSNPPIPMLTLPLIGDVPKLPDTLAAAASIRL